MRRKMARRVSWMSIAGMIVGWLIPSSGCTSGAEVHVIPDGFVGPVVIAYGVAGGEEAKKDETGALILRIPNGGRLQLRTEAPRSGGYKMTFVFEAQDGSRRVIPYKSDPARLQVFADVDGTTATIDGQSVGALRWQAYIVGVPDQRDDWVAQRDRFTEETMRLLVRTPRSTKH